MLSPRMLGRALLALFVLSGFAGLVYQSIWSHYLGLTLGHAAYAQSLVLAIFMGGMALGAWLVSRFGLGWRRLILAYAVVEGLIGLMGLGFHPLFVAYSAFSQDQVYPALQAEWAVRAWQWGTAALLIAPQSVLLGMTFPLMSGGYLRVAPREDGEILGGLYFSNSLGAALGALAATFVLMPWIGLPGTVASAGWINLLVAALALALARVMPASAPATGVRSEPERSAENGPPPRLALAPMLLLAAFVTGATSFVYEIGWVRLLNQALGTTVHSFELMLAAFILGLACGGWLIRRRSARIDDAVAWAGYAQVWMGMAALASLPLFANSFRWVGGLMRMAARNDAGYDLFLAGSAGIAVLVMFPAAFFAGMTLPLLTMALLRHGQGEASIGRAYAANTLGAIAGVMAAMHVLVPLLGLRLAVTLAALGDGVLGIVLLRFYARGFSPLRYLAAFGAFALMLALSLALGRPDPRALVSGVYRTGAASADAEARVHYLRDGKTATVSVFNLNDWATISTNGKPDASLAVSSRREQTPDEVTMILAAVLPLAMHPAPDRVAVIGWGSGLSTHTLLGSPAPKRVDSVEIEAAMVQGAQLFGDRVVRAYRDPRSKLHIDDARTYFSTGRRQFEVILSEPSNPWVSGVAALFTREFYGFLRGHLSADGILVQWLQAYEIDDALLGTMVAALLAEFPHVEMYLTNSSDLLLVASPAPLPAPDYSRLRHTPLDLELGRVGLESAAEFELRKLGGRAVLETLVRMIGAAPHSDFYPVVALNAPRARFLNEMADVLIALRTNGLPVLDLLEGRTLPARAAALVENPYSTVALSHRYALTVNDAMTGSRGLAVLAARDAPLAAQVSHLRTLSQGPVPEELVPAWLDAAAEVARYSIGLLPPEDHHGVWIDPAWIDPAEQPEPVRVALAVYAAAAARDAAALREAGLAALPQMPRGRPVAEQMLLLAMLGAAASGDYIGVGAIEALHGRGIPPGKDYPGLRQFLLAWADRSSQP